MISYLQEPYKQEEVEKILHPLVKEWFFHKYLMFSKPQLYAPIEIHKRNNILVSAPTGGTKTLTAFLSILNELVTRAFDNTLENKVYAVYISPLKALNNDIAINLETPLKEIKELAKLKGIKLPDIRVGVRTGDTTPSQKQKMLQKTPHIIITTPESLAIMLTSSKFYELLKNTSFAIIDEIHALADSKRAVHLSLLLERLEHISPGLTRIGLSATVEPIEEVAKFLVGNNRYCKIAKIDLVKNVDLKVISPLPELVSINYNQQHNAFYKMLDDLIQEHKTTLVFTNTRAGTERIVNHLKTLFPSKYVENIGAHHGSLSKKHRLEVEESLKQGRLKAVVCSTSLELGIDIGFIDLVVCIGSPKSVARFLQRVGRAGHQLHSTIKGRMIVLDRDDLVECSILLKDAIEKKIDRINIPSNCLDVLAQVIHGAAISEIWDLDDLYKMIKQSYCYSSLTKKDFQEVISYLAGEFVDLQSRYIFAKIWYNKEENKIGKKGMMSRVLHMTNIGTIPDQTGIKVKFKEKTIGTIDEAFLERLERNDVFVLGGDTYEFKFARGMTAQVIPAPSKTPTVPSWFSEQLPLSFDLANDIQKFRRLMDSWVKNNYTKEQVLEFLNNYLYLDDNAANSIYKYFKEQQLYSEIPSDKKIIIENYSEGFENSKKYIVFHTLYGRRVNDVLSRAVAYMLGKQNKIDIEVGINDNGFFLSHKKHLQARKAFEMLTPENIQAITEDAIDKTEVLKRRFRHCASRALMILREYKGKRKNVGRVQVSSMILLNAVKRISEDFSILREAKREVLNDLMDLENAKKILKDIKENNITIKEINTSIPSPFALNLVMEGYTDILRIEDRLEFVNRMHSMILAKISKEHDIAEIA